MGRLSGLVTFSTPPCTKSVWVLLTVNRHSRGFPKLFRSKEKCVRASKDLKLLARGAHLQQSSGLRFRHFIFNFFLSCYCSESLNKLAGSLHLSTYSREGSSWVLCGDKEQTAPSFSIKPGKSEECSPESKSCPWFVKTHSSPCGARIQLSPMCE